MKRRILGCIFSEKIYFNEEKDATINFTKPIEVIFQIFNELQSSKIKKQVEFDLFSQLAPPIDRSCSRKWLGFINFPKDIRHLMNISYRTNTIGGNLQFVTTFHQNRSRDFQNSNGHLGALLLYHRPLESRLQSIRFGPCKSLNKLRPHLLTKHANVPN